MLHGLKEEHMEVMTRFGCCLHALHYAKRILQYHLYKHLHKNTAITAFLLGRWLSSWEHTDDFAEDPSLVLSTHIRWLVSACNSPSGEV